MDSAMVLNKDWASRPSVTRDELAQQFSQSMPQIEERVLGYDPAKVRAAREMAESQGHVWDDLGLANQNRYIRQADGRGITEYGNDPKFQQYTLPGGTNYREIVLKHDANKPPISENQYYQLSDKAALGPLSEAEKEQIKAYTAWKNNDANLSPLYKSTHYPDDPGYIAHLRFSDRTGPNGEKILHVEEAQSDRGQAGRKEGFSSPEDYARWLKADNATRTAYQKAITEHRRLTDSLSPPINERFMAGRESPRDYERRIEALEEQRQDALRANPEFAASAERLRQASDARRAVGPPPSTEGVPKGPYVTSTQGWTDLVVKRILKEAAEGGYDKIIWTPGAEQSKRYNLSNHVKSIDYMKEGDDAYRLGIVDKSGQGVDLPKDVFNAKELEEYLGTDVANKIISDQGQSYRGRNHKSLEGLDLEVGGKGMEGYYGKIFPKSLQDQAKRHDKGAKIEPHDLITKPGEKVADEAALAENSQLIERGRFWDDARGENVNGYRVTSPGGQELGVFEDLPDAHDALLQVLGDAKEPDTIIKTQSLTVTPEMRESIINRGQQSFRASGGSVVDRALGVIRQRHADGNFVPDAPQPEDPGIVDRALSFLSQFNPI
jgi:hypothetical protein